MLSFISNIGKEKEEKAVLRRLTPGARGAAVGNRLTQGQKEHFTP